MLHLKETGIDFTAGWLGGACGLLVGHPMDTVKVRLQAMHFEGVIQCVISTLKNESASGFYKGMAFPIASVGFINSVYFGGYTLSLKMLHYNLNDSEVFKEIDIPYSHVAIASAAGGFLQWIPSCPVEVVKVKLQVQRDMVDHFWNRSSNGSHKVAQFHSPFDCIRKVYNTDGIRRGLYRGGSVMLLRDIIASCVYFPSYEYGYRTLRGENLQYKTAALLLSGGIAGVFSWISILPFDVVKSRLQADNIESPKYKNTLDCFLKTYSEGGIKVFFRGCSVVAARAFPVNAVIFYIYSYSVDFLTKLL